MARYLCDATYSTAGLKGLAAAGAKARLQAVDDLTASVGGSLVSFDFAVGGARVYLICELPDDEAAHAIGLAIGATGAVDSFNFVKLLTAEQVDVAISLNANYVPPGG